MRKTVAGLLFGATCSIALFGISIEHRWGFPQAIASPESSEVYRKLNLLGDVFEQIRNSYVEKPDDTKLIEDAIRGMLSGLDPHSSYMSARDFSDMQQSTRGEFGGLGIEVTMEDGVIKVITPIDDTPASKAGIMANDLIIQIDDVDVKGMSLNQAVEKMRGPPNTAIKLKVVRKGQGDPVDMSLTRAVVTVRSVRGRVEDDVAYIRITVFNEQTTEGLKKEISKQSALIGKKLKGYIIDLRNNPGGLLDEAVTVSDAFLERGEIVSTRGRNPNDVGRAQADRGSMRHSPVIGDLTKGKPIMVLINGGSASASEIVAGALQDHRRATIVGSRSFGKGSVQTIIPLGLRGENGALRLTTARYYTPSGKTIQAKGIVPDVEVLQDEPEELKGKTSSKGEASLKGHLKTGDEEQSGSQAYVPPNAADDKALQEALRLLRTQ